MNKEDLCHLTGLVINNKLPRLTTSLELKLNKLCDMEDELDELIKACVTHYQVLLESMQRTLNLNLEKNNLSEELREKWNRRYEIIKFDISF